MAHFLLQADKDALDINYYILKDLLKKNRHTHDYEEVFFDDIDKHLEADVIPIGTIDFVRTYINNVHSIDHEVPVELPVYLQTEEFLKRVYEVVTWDRIPRSGKYFLKDVSRLKEYSDIMDTDMYDVDDFFRDRIDKYDTSFRLSKEHLYQVSSLLPIESEYRVYVLGKEIETIACYEGNPLLYPDSDLIKKAVLLINENEKHLKSYTIDVAVGAFGTALLEVHNFTSVGLYNSIWQDNLLDAYVDGINYLVNDNKCKYI